MRCQKVWATIALSEPLEKFIACNVKHNRKFNEFAITSIVEIDERKYKVLKPFNPTNEGYFRLIKKDYSKFVTDDDEYLNLEPDEGDE